MALWVIVIVIASRIGIDVAAAANGAFVASSTGATPCRMCGLGLADGPGGERLDHTASARLVSRLAILPSTTVTSSSSASRCTRSWVTRRVAMSRSCVRSAMSCMISAPRS